MTRPSPTATTQQTPLQKVVAQYRKYVHGRLDSLVPQVSGLRIAVGRGDRDGAKFGWLTAQQTWEEVGAAYGASVCRRRHQWACQRAAAGPERSGLHRPAPHRVRPLHRSAAPDRGRYVDQLASDLDSCAPARHGRNRSHATCRSAVTRFWRTHCAITSPTNRLRLGHVLRADLGRHARHPGTARLLKPLFPPPVLGQNVYDTVQGRAEHARQAVNAQGRRPVAVLPVVVQAPRQPVNGAIGGALEVLYRVPQVSEAE